MTRGKKRGKKGRRPTPDAAAAAAPASGPLRLPAVAPGAWPLMVLLLAVVAALTLGLAWNEDLWWYLASGEVILQQGSIPDHDLFLSTSTESTGWPSHSWLWTVLCALIYRALGLSGVVVFGALVALAAVGLVFACARVDRFGVANALLAGLVVVSAAERLSLKSELASWLLLVVFFYLLDREAPFGRRTLVFLLVLQALWANLHAGWVLGVAVALAYGVGGWIERQGARKRGATAAPRGAPLWLPLALFAASFVTPEVGERLRILRAGTEITTSRLSGGSLSVAIDELQGTFEADDPTFAALYLVALAAGAGILLWAGPRPRRAARLCFVAGMAVLAASAIRHVAGLVIAVALVGLATLGEKAAAARAAEPAGRRWLALEAAAAVALAALLAGSAAGILLHARDLEMGQSEEHFFTLNPIATCPGAADYVVRRGLTGEIFNDMILGGYLSHRFYPIRKPFLDNRVLRGQLSREYVAMSTDRDRWLEAEQKYGFEIAILSSLGVPSHVPLRSILREDPRWSLTYADPLAAVFVRDRRSLRSLHPYGTGEAGDEGIPLAFPEDGPGGLARRLGRLFLRTDVAQLLHQYLSVLGRLELYEEVEILAGRALELRPTDAALHRDRGSARMLLERPAEGLEDLRRALELEPDDAMTHYTYALGLRDSGQPREALAAVDRALELEPGDPRFTELRQRLETALGL